METGTNIINQMKVKWRCPSNIAIVKYWGKKGIQIPCNSSLSLTLSNSYTEVEVLLSEKTVKAPVELSYYFEGKINEQFSKRVAQFLERNSEEFPYLEDFAITIYSTNSFPHSAGIASSASAFGAIALAMLDVTYQIKEKEIDDTFYYKASNLARLASGSASRSLFSGYAIWGEHPEIQGTSDQNAIEIKDIHPNFQSMKDAILIVDDQPKKVSSSIGHALMENNPYAETRFKQANERTAKLIDILKTGDRAAFIHLCESEALTLHAMMMASMDYYLLVKPGTITIIDRLLEFRNKNNIPVCFTLDAGPNVHVLYPKEVEKEVEAFINNKLTDTYTNVIFDEGGKGPKKLNN